MTTTDSLTITRAEYQSLLDRIEDLEDAASLGALEARVVGHGVPEDALPVELFDRILAGESRLRVWREHRGLSIADLAEAADLPTSRMDAIERGKEPGTIADWRRLAKALSVALDEIASE